MSSETTAPTESGNWTRLLIVFLVAFDAAAFWQWAGGAYQSEFGGHPQEGAHYVGALFARDAMLRGWKNASHEPHGEPGGMGARFEQTIFEQNPSVVPAVWPPSFALVQSAWAAAFGASRISVLLLVAALAAGVATFLYGAVREEFGEWAAIAAALLWLCASLVRGSYEMVMPEMLGTLTMLGATLAWGRFLDLGHVRDAVGFGILALLAVLTEGAGLAVALMAGLSLVFTWRRLSLAKWTLWVANIIPVFLGLLVWLLKVDRFDFRTRSALAHAASFYAGKLAVAAGLAVTVFAVAGVCCRCFLRSERKGRWVAIASLVVSVFAYGCARPDRMEARHVVAAAPALIMLAVAGVRSIAGLMAARAPDARGRHRREWLWILLLVLLVLPLEVLKHRRKDFSGFGPIVRMLLADAPRGARILIASDPTGEGMFISELVMNDRRRGFTIETAGLSLVTPESRKGDPRTWRERFADDRVLLDYLTNGRIQYVVLDDAVPFEQRADYHDQIRRVIEENIRNFWPGPESPIVRGGEIFGRPAKVYRVLAGG